MAQVQTAIDKQLKQLVKTVCKTGTLDIFTDDVTKPEGNKYPLITAW